MATVVFTVRARTRLEQRLAPRLAVDPNALGGCMTDIENALQGVFPPPAEMVVVQDLYTGFRVRDGEYILLVEVANSGTLDGVHVVKFGPHERLADEWDAWHACRPHGLRHDLVLMDLRRVPDAGPVQALVYADAQQFIGVDQTVPLEAAVLAAVRFGGPRIESVAGVLFQVYERLGLLLYRHAADFNTSDETFFSPHCLDPRLLTNLDAWDRPTGLPYMRRVAANTQAQDHPLNRQFRDPVYMFRHILRHPQSAAFIPRMLRGRAHGDLHGRNVLVGQVGDQVMWPAVFDYGNMSRTNWVGLDFAKMETELKIRAYPLVFPMVSAEYVLPFEVRLCEATERGRYTDQWAAPGADPPPHERLFHLLLYLRKLAGAHLGRPARSGLWLAEYYFLLALYGLNAGRFPNLNPVEVLGAYLSAGCAAARYSPVRERRTP